MTERVPQDPDLVARLLAAVRAQTDDEREHVLRIAADVERRRAAAQNRREKEVLDDAE